MKQYLAEIIITLLLIVVAVLLWNPYWMPMGAVLVTIICFVVLFGSFAIFVWKEQGGDEREVLIRHVASRLAYLVTALILAIGIVYQILATHEVDAWLIAAFIVTVLAKAIGYGYAKGRY